MVLGGGVRGVTNAGKGVGVDFERSFVVACESFGKRRAGYAAKSGRLEVLCNTEFGQIVLERRGCRAGQVCRDGKFLRVLGPHGACE